MGAAVGLTILALATIGAARVVRVALTGLGRVRVRLHRPLRRRAPSVTIDHEALAAAIVARMEARLDERKGARS